MKNGSKKNNLIESIANTSSLHSSSVISYANSSNGVFFILSNSSLSFDHSKVELSRSNKLNKTNLHLKGQFMGKVKVVQ